MASSATVSLQWAGAALLLLMVLPLARGADQDLEELAWPIGATADEISPQQQSLLFLPQQLAAVERAKRTGLVNDMRNNMGGVRVSGMGNWGDEPSLSIVNSLDLIRKNYLNELIRRRLRQNEGKVLANRELLNKIGKRSVPNTTHGQQQTDLRGLLLRRQVRSASAENESASTPRHEQNSRGGAAFL